MKLVALETIRFRQSSNLLIVRLRTDEGLVGLGETFFGPRAVEAYLHETAAPLLLDTELRAAARSMLALEPYVGYQGAGAEMRGLSALDIALWDLRGRASGQPLYELLGGAVRPSIPLYNTCAGYRYVQGPGGQSMDNWGLPARQPAGPYEDLQAFLTRPGELAADLVDRGIKGMKIWPFDTFAERHDGHDIQRRELAEGVAIVETIREAVGDRIDVMIELHGLWDLRSAKRIADALEDLDIAWLEDPIRPDCIEALGALSLDTSIPLAGGETLVGATAFRRLLAAGALDIPIVDSSWTGGLSEAVRVAATARDWRAPVAAHDCTGPISLAVCTHFAVSQPNALVQETVRAYYEGWYRELVTTLPPIDDGTIAPPEGPGLGLDLVTDLEARPDVSIVTSSA